MVEPPGEPPANKFAIEVRTIREDNLSQQSPLGSGVPAECANSHFLVENSLADELRSLFAERLVSFWGVNQQEAEGFPLAV